jgi:hypothetical protein
MQVKLKGSIGVQYKVVKRNTKTTEATKDGMIYLPCLVRKLFSADAVISFIFFLSLPRYGCLNCCGTDCISSIVIPTKATWNCKSRTCIIEKILGFISFLHSYSLELYCKFCILIMKCKVLGYARIHHFSLMCDTIFSSDISS